jgi:hypothetical protein
MMGAWLWRNDGCHTMMSGHDGLTHPPPLQQVTVQALEEALALSRQYPFQQPGIRSLVSTLEAVHGLRGMALRGEWSAIGGSATDPDQHDVTAREEMALVLQEGKDRCVIDLLTLAMDNNTLKGEVGALNTHSLDVAELQESLASARRLGFVSEESQRLFTNVEYLSNLLGQVSRHMWEGVLSPDIAVPSREFLRRLQSLLEQRADMRPLEALVAPSSPQPLPPVAEDSVPGWVARATAFDLLPAVQDTIQLVKREARDRLLRLQLFLAISRSGVTGEVAALDVTHVALQPLRDAVSEAEAAGQRLSADARGLLRTADLLLDVRTAVAAGQAWQLDPEVLQAQVTETCTDNGGSLSSACHG